MNLELLLLLLEEENMNIELNSLIYIYNVHYKLVS